MPLYKPFDWYQTPVYYDIIFDADTIKEADFLEAVQKKHGLTRGHRVLEPACGSGRLVAEMAGRGWRVSGFDIAQPMLDFTRNRLKRNGVTATLTQSDMASFSYKPQFDLAHCLISTFKYLPDESAALSHLQCIARALKPGGIYVLGFHLTDYTDRARSRERWVERRDGVEVTCNIQSWPADRRKRTEQVRSRIIAVENGLEKRYETHWTFRTYSLRQMKSLLASAPAVPGLEHVATYDFGHDIENPIRFDGEHLDNVLILRKRN